MLTDATQLRVDLSPLLLIVLVICALKLNFIPNHVKIYLICVFFRTLS